MKVRLFSFLSGFAKFTTAIMRETVSSIGRALEQSRGMGSSPVQFLFTLIYNTLEG